MATENGMAVAGQTVPANPESMVDIAVVGAGPAGMTAAIYGRRAGKSVVLFEALVPGGQIVNTPDIENYPVVPHLTGFDFADRLRAQAEALGATIVYERVDSLEPAPDGSWVLSTAAGPRRARAVILATGSATRKLGAENEDALAGKGISYCATCDGAFFRGKDVAVVGGGNTALEDALYLSDLARRVVLVHRRHEFRGDAATVERLRARSNVEFALGCTVARLVADGGRLQGAVLADAATGATRTIAVQGLFVAVGRIPETAAFAHLVPLDPGGFAAAGEDCRTPRSGLFVAGDVRSKAVRQLVTATADGAVAATAAVQYLQSLAP